MTVFLLYIGKYCKIICNVLNNVQLFALYCKSKFHIVGKRHLQRGIYSTGCKPRNKYNYRKVILQTIATQLKTPPDVSFRYHLDYKGQYNMDKRNQTINFSAKIEETCKLMASAISDYYWHGEQVNILDKLTQDYLHSLELENLTYSERAKVATKLATCRQERRKHKDIVQALTPLVEYLESDKGRQCANLLKEVLGQTRKVEKYISSRVYIPRVRKDE